MPDADAGAGAKMGRTKRQPRRSFAAGEFLALLFRASPTVFDVLLLLTGTFFAVVGGITYPILGTLYGKLIDDLNSGSCDSDNGSTYEAVRAKVLLVAAVAVAQFVIIYIYMGCWTLFGERLVRRLRSRYLAALLTQDLAYFEQVPPGDISSRLDSDIQAIQDGTSEKVAIVLTSVSYFVTAYAISFNLNPKLAGLMSTMIPAYILVGAVCSHLLTKHGQQVSKLTDRATSIAAEGLSNIKLVQAYRAQHRLEAIYAGYLRQMQAAATAQASIEALQMGLLYFVSYAANALAIWWGSRDIARSLASSISGTTIGSVYTVIFVLVDASFVITRIAPHFKIFAGAVTASRNLSAVMERKSPLDTVPVGQGAVLRSVDAAIEFRDLSFRYPSRPKQLVLDHVSFSFPAKKMTAIVGLSGSGKSTVASLIPRLYEFESGEITIDNTDIRDMNLHHLRSLVAVVEQSTSLLQGSILENVAAGLLSSPKHSHLHQAILDGRLSAMVEAVRAGEDLKHASSVDPEVQEVVHCVQDAVELAEASAFVNRLHHGLASDAGHNGRQLSGGQVQRLGIARALIKDTPILILDEATASLDSMTEREIQATIEKRCSGKTIICIAHRLSTIRNADKVIVMGAGKVLEEGSYAELIDRDAHFARMVAQQDMGGHSRASTVMSSSSLPLVASNLDRALAHEIEPPTIRHNEQQIVDYPLETTPLLGSTIPPTSASKTEASSLVRLFPKVMALARSQRLFLVAGALSAVLAGISAPISAVVFGNMVGSMSPCNGWRQVLSSGQFYGAAFLVLAVYDTVTTTARGAALGKFSKRVLLSSRILTFRSLFYQNVQWHEDAGRNPNTLLSYLTNDASSLGAMSGSLVGVCLSIIVNLGLGIILSHVIAWKIAVVLLGAVPLLLASGFLRIRMMAHFTEKHREAFAHSVGVAKDAIDHIPTVALYSLETYAERTYLRALQEPYDQTLGLIVVGNFWLALSFGLGSLVYAFAYWWGAYQVEQGAYSSTQLFIVLPALLVSAQQSGQLFTLAPDISRAGVAAKQIFKQLDIGPPGSKISEPSEIGQDSDPESVLSPERSRRPKHAHGLALEFREVSFSYPSRKKQHVLRDLSLYIPADTLCAFTGPSGAGKSTLFSLMLDHYQPTEGQVLLDGQSLQTLPAGFRDDIAIVPQESVLFNASIEFNITVGLSPGATATRSEIEEVCRLANIHGVISKLPDGYDTIVGGTGSGLLSGGQKQRIALARALIRKPRMLLLDEATSALDTESERIWRESLEALMNRQQHGGGMKWGRMTVVAIAHRLSTVRRAARIFWIEGGSCEFFGTHEELYSACTGYRNAVDGQGFAAE